MLELDALTVEDVCQLLGLSRNTVYKLAKEGSLPSFKVGRKLRFSRSDVESVLANRALAGSSASAGKENACDSPAALTSATLDQVVEQLRGPKGVPFVLAGEDVVLGHLAQHLRAYGFDAAALHTNGYAALASMYAGRADAALVSLYDFKTNSYNVPFVQRLCPGMSLVIIHLFRRRQGMFVASGNPKKINTWLALSREDVRIAAREKGCGLRVLMDQKMLGLEANLEEVESRAVECDSNALALVRVARGICDVCLGYREESLLLQAADARGGVHDAVPMGGGAAGVVPAGGNVPHAAHAGGSAVDAAPGTVPGAALASGLKGRFPNKNVQFIAQQMDSFDLVVRHTDKTHKAIRALCQIAASDAFKTELSGMMACDVSACGSVLYRC